MPLQFSRWFPELLWVSNFLQAGSTGQGGEEAGMASAHWNVIAGELGAEGEDVTQGGGDSWK